MRMIGVSGIVGFVGMMLLIGCVSDSPGGDASVVAPAAQTSQPPVAPGPTPETAGASSTIPVDAKGCLDVGALRSTPIALTGKLVVTYFEPTLESQKCDWDDETKKYWCKSPVKTSAECAEVGPEIWCPNANPSPEALGDPQELALFDLANPAAGPKRWTNNTVHEAELDISPDGKRVVYAVRKKMDAFDDADGMGIWVIDADGQNARKVVDRAGHTGIPTWLPPNDDKFTFIADGLHVFDIASSTTINVTIDQFDSGLVIDPEASHDGKKLTFKADKSGGNVPVIWVMDFDGTAGKGTNVKQLTKGYSDHDPVFTHDNKKILFERYYGPGEWNQFHLDKIEHPEINQWGIVEVDVESAKERVLIPHDKCGKHFWWLPTLSPDGKHVMFIHDYVAEDGYQDLWVSDLNGENAQPVPNTRGIHWFDWSN